MRGRRVQKAASCLFVSQEAVRHSEFIHNANLNYRTFGDLSAEIGGER